MKTLGKSLILGAMLLAGASQAQTVRINGLVELSGTGATSGTNFDNGIKLAVREINAAGGILGRKVDYVSYDTQSQPGVAKALAQKAVDQTVRPQPDRIVQRPGNDRACFSGQPTATARCRHSGGGVCIDGGHLGSAGCVLCSGGTPFDCVSARWQAVR